jgi:hypothetical protein
MKSTYKFLIVLNFIAICTGIFNCLVSSDLHSAAGWFVAVCFMPFSIDKWFIELEKIYKEEYDESEYDESES